MTYLTTLFYLLLPFKKKKVSYYNSYSLLKKNTVSRGIQLNRDTETLKTNLHLIRMHPNQARNLHAQERTQPQIHYI